jgi:hypothetical protein
MEKVQNAYKILVGTPDWKVCIEKSRI